MAKRQDLTKFKAVFDTPILNKMSSYIFKRLLELNIGFTKEGMFFDMTANKPMSRTHIKLILRDDLREGKLEGTDRNKLCLYVDVALENCIDRLKRISDEEIIEQRVISYTPKN